MSYFRKRFSTTSSLLLILTFVFVSRCSSFRPTICLARQSASKPISKYHKTCISQQDTKICPRFWDGNSMGTLAHSSTSGLFMANSNDEGPGLLTTIGVGFIIVLFVVSGLLPSLLQGGGDRDLSIADSVVTRQDVPGKLANFESSQDRLSRSEIQEKLSSIPVFYLATTDGTMKTDIFLSYADAKDVSSGMEGTTVKVTTLDQVMYPLVLKRGRMRMAPPPSEVAKAEQDLSVGEAGSDQKKYRLVPSKTALRQAEEFKMDLADNDLPMFVADRLAFANPKGPQLPLFLDKDDCITSYQRLRGGKSNLPEQPNIRTTSLLDTITSMEKGTRPGVSQLAFYATAEDLSKASEIFQ